MVLYGVTCHYSRLFLKTSKESEQTHQLRGRHTDSSAQNTFLPGSKSRQSALFWFMRAGLVLRKHKALRGGGGWVAFREGTRDAR